MKYLAINLGHIIKTFSMARKPKEFWAASYMFSYLMECILARLQKEKESLELISPYYTSKGTPRIGVGLYPDRSFYGIKQEIDINRLLDDALILNSAKL